MTTLFLVRHGRSTANTAGVLAGRAEGISLDETGRTQAENAAARLAQVPLDAAVVSPIQRCRETAELLLAGRSEIPQHVDNGLSECDYGDWTNRPLKDLAAEELWKTVQRQPSAARFPGGESLAAMWSRAVGAVRDWDQRLEAESGPRACWLAVTHGDIAKAILADALGIHLDGFQRIMVDPASVSVIRYTPERPYVLTMNSTAGDLAGLVPPAPAPDAAATEGAAGSGDDAAVGGGLGASGGRVG